MFKFYWQLSQNACLLGAIQMQNSLLYAKGPSPLHVEHLCCTHGRPVNDDQCQNMPLFKKRGPFWILLRDV